MGATFLRKTLKELEKDYMTVTIFLLCNHLDFVWDSLKIWNMNEDFIVALLLFYLQ